MNRKAPIIDILSASAVLALLIAPLGAPALAEEPPRMLYLVQGVATDAGGQPTPEQMAEILEEVVIPSLEALNRYQEEGKILGGGLPVGARAVAFLVEAPSHDEVASLLRGLPFWGIIDWKVTPLESFENRVTLESQVLETMKQATDE